MGKTVYCIVSCSHTIDRLHVFPDCVSIRSFFKAVSQWHKMEHKKHHDLVNVHDRFECIHVWSKRFFFLWFCVALRLQGLEWELWCCCHAFQRALLNGSHWSGQIGGLQKARFFLCFSPLKERASSWTNTNSQSHKISEGTIVFNHAPLKDLFGENALAWGQIEKHFSGEKLLGSAVLSGVVSSFCLEFPNSKSFLQCQVGWCPCDSRIRLRLMDWIHVLPEHEKTCTVMQRAVRLDRVEMIQELRKRHNWDVNCDKCAETPLGQLMTVVRCRLFDDN